MYFCLELHLPSCSRRPSPLPPAPTTIILHYVAPPPAPSVTNLSRVAPEPLRFPCGSSPLRAPSSSLFHFVTCLLASVHRYRCRCRRRRRRAAAMSGVAMWFRRSWAAEPVVGFSILLGVVGTFSGLAFVFPLMSLSTFFCGPVGGASATTPGWQAWCRSLPPTAVAAVRRMTSWWSVPRVSARDHPYRRGHSCPFCLAMAWDDGSSRCEVGAHRSLRGGESPVARRVAAHCRRNAVSARVG